MNIWIPDGMKDITVDRLAPRQRLLAALDEAISEKLDPAHHIDAVESKLFGIGAESYTVGSNEFYMGYATSRQTALCLDAGHFHPTEVISDKISAAMLYVPRLLLHVSRPVRWDSDHVVLLDDETQAIASEIIRHDLFDRVHIGLDFFDASINRIAAWVIGTRNMKKALLRALLEPDRPALRQLEERRRLHRAPGAAGRAEVPAVAGGVGDVLPASRYACGQPVAGQRARHMRKTVLSQRVSNQDIARTAAVALAGPTKQQPVGRGKRTRHPAFNQQETQDYADHYRPPGSSRA